MTEQVRTVFYLIEKAKNAGNRAQAGQNGTGTAAGLGGAVGKAIGSIGGASGSIINNVGSGQSFGIVE